MTSFGNKFQNVPEKKSHNPRTMMKVLKSFGGKKVPVCLIRFYLFFYFFYTRFLNLLNQVLKSVVKGF